MRRPLFNWTVAMAALVAAMALRWLLEPVMAGSLPLVTVFGAVVAAVWVGGWRPAVVVGVLGYAACSYLFIEPRGTLWPQDVSQVVGLVAYAVTCALIVWIGETMRQAQRRSGERGELLRVTLGSIGDGVIATDTKGRIVYLNPVAESLTGWTLSEARGRPLDEVFRIINEQTRQPAPSPAARALRVGAVVGLANHTLLLGKDGVERAIDDSAAPIRDALGEVAGCVLIFRDVSRRRQEEKARTERLLEARLLASIVESSDDAIVSKSLDGVIRSWNAGAERIFGYSAEQAVGRHISLIIPVARLAEEDQIIASLKAGKRVDHFETERLRADGRRIAVSLTISPIKDDDGNVVGASKIVRDVTRQRQAETERERFVTLVENSADFIGICDVHGVPFYVNRAGLDMVGLESVDEARHTHLRDFFFPEDQTKVMEEFVPAVMEKGRGEMEVRFRHFRTGEARWMTYKVLRLTDADGRIEALGTVSHDVTAHKQLEEHLRRLAADLSSADRRKSEFLATLSHELRNPLAPLRHLLEVLHRAGDDAGLRQKALDTMGRQLSRLVRLVDDLLDLNRITLNRIELRKGRVELGSVLHQALEGAVPLAEFAGHDVEMLVPPDPIVLHADAVRLTQVFGNLIHNACKYTAPGGKIRVLAARRGEEAVVRVEDTGVGIPADKLDSIFDMFTQVDSSSRRSQGGLGIGLALVKRLVQLHGGSVEARSAGEGQGSSFEVRLPVAVASDEQATPAAVPLAGTEATLSRRVLVVDDNRDAASVLAQLLEMGGHEVDTAHDGAEALATADRRHPDVVLLDIGLPTLNGYEVCRQIRERPWGRKTIVIALTGWGQEADRQLSREAGFDGHLVKPVDYPELLALLDSLSEARRAG